LGGREIFLTENQDHDRSWSWTRGGLSIFALSIAWELPSLRAGFFRRCSDRSFPDNGVRWAIIPNVQIAVVEDDQLVRDFVVDTLEFSVNRKIHTFDDGFSAWQYMQASHPIHILFADIHVPEIDGLELTARVKAVKPEIICILTSGDPCG
jgi:hypothetical protein